MEGTVLSAEKAVPPHSNSASIKEWRRWIIFSYLSKLLGFKKTVCAVGLSSLLFLRVLEDTFQ